MIKITTDLELNTATEPDLVTENYELDVLGLKNAGDFRKFSKSFIKLDKIVKNIDDATKTLDDRISSVNTNKADKTINITAGSGLKGGGNISVNRTISVLASDDSVVVGDTGIKVNTYNGLDSTSTTRPLSANAGKLLNDKGLYPRSTLSGTVNLDNITQQGLYDCSNLVQASFVGYTGEYYPFGTLEVLVGDKGNIIQMYIPHSTTTPILFRMKYYNSSWTSWRALVDNSNSWRIQAKEIPTNSDLDNYTEKGLYFSRRGSNIIAHTPYERMGAFELTVTGIASDYTTQLIKDYRNNNYYVRTYNGDGGSQKWSEWNKIALDTEVHERVYTKSLTTLPENNIPWNAKTGIYVGTYTGASSLIWHMYTEVTTSTPSVQLKFNFRNGGIAYRSSRDGYGFENGWTKIITEKEFGVLETKLGDYKYLGSATSNGASVPFGDYTDYVVIARYSAGIYFTSYYFHKSMLSILKGQQFYIPAGEGGFKVDKVKKAFVMTDIGLGADGGIDVYVR